MRIKHNGPAVRSYSDHEFEYLTESRGVPLHFVINERNAWERGFARLCERVGMSLAYDC